MPSLITGYHYDIFISYRHNDNRSGWVTEFVKHLQDELATIIKEPVSIYFDVNPDYGILETHHVDKTLEGKLKSLIFIPIISQTYCDTKSFAWRNEFCVFNKLANEDGIGRDVTLVSGNVTSRILPIKIHELDSQDKAILENELRGMLRPVEFIFKSSGVNRPLSAKDDEVRMPGKILFSDQVNKVANAIKDIIVSVQSPVVRKDTQQTILARPKTNKSNWKPVAIVAVALLLLVFAVVGYYFAAFPNDRSPGNSIAVLPFVDLTEEQDQEHFSDGMMEEILTHLSKIEDLRVISRTSSMQYKNSKSSVKKIAAELGVTNILEGSVRRSGDRVRITVQLIDAVNEKHLWSEDYDYRKMGDIFEVQSDVSIRVAEILKTKLTEQEKQSLSKSPTNNPDAFKFYVKGRYYWDKRTRQSFDSAEVYFKKAIEIDPQYALAYSGLADCYTLNRQEIPQRDATPIAKAYATKALALDSTLGEAWTTMAFIRSHHEFDWEGSKTIFEKAIRLNPSNPAAHLFYGNVLFFKRETRRAMNESKVALNLDPLSFSVNSALGTRYFQTRQYDLAIQHGLKFKTLFGYAPSFYGLTLVQKKNYQEAIQVFNNLPTTQFDRVSLISYGYAMAGQKEQAKRQLAKALDEKPIRSHFYLAIAYVALGDHNNALTQLEESDRMMELVLLGMKVNPLLDPLRNEPRFKALLKKMNLD